MGQQELLTVYELSIPSCNAMDKRVSYPSLPRSPCQRFINTKKEQTEAGRLWNEIAKNLGGCQTVRLNQIYLRGLSGRDLT